VHTQKDVIYTCTKHAHTGQRRQQQQQQQQQQPYAVRDKGEGVSNKSGPAVAQRESGALQPLPDARMVMCEWLDSMKARMGLGPQ